MYFDSYVDARFAEYEQTIADLRHELTSTKLNRRGVNEFVEWLKTQEAEYDDLVRLDHDEYLTGCRDAYTNALNKVLKIENIS